MIVDEKGKWVNSAEYAKIKGVSRNALNLLYFIHKNTSDIFKFKNINGRRYFLIESREVENAKKELENLYFEVRDKFESELAMMKYFAPKIHVTHIALYGYFSVFSLKMHERNLMLIKLFKEYLKN